MNVFVEFDEHCFKVAGLTRHDRHDRLSGRSQEKIGGKSTWDTPLPEDTATRGRSVAHLKRYADTPGQRGT
jgi:hypothetical protein